MSQLVHALRTGMPPRFIGRGDAKLTQRASPAFGRKWDQGD